MPSILDTLKKENNWLFPVLLLLITIATFAPCFSLGFVYWDDPGYIFENQSLAVFKDHWSWQGIWHIFTTDVGANYNPLPIVTFAIEKYFFAPNPLAAPFIYHFDNVLLHLGCTLCVYVLFLKLGVNKTGAFIGALLFGIHPMRVESVAWVTERKDVLYGFFYLLSLVYYVKFAEATSGKGKWFVYTLLFALLAYFSKVQAVSLPLSMISIDFYLKRKWYSPKVLAEKLPFFVFSLACGIANLYFLNRGKVLTPHNVVQYNLLDQIAVGSYSYFIYLLKFIYPYKMANTYPYLLKIRATYITLALSVILTVGGLLWAKRKEYDYLIFGWLFFFFNIVFLLQVIPAGIAFISDRFTYIAYVGLFFIVAKTYEYTVKRFADAKPAIYAGLTIYVIFFIILTTNQIKVWQNTVTLWSHAIKVQPDNYFNYVSLGDFTMKAALGEYDTTGIKMKPDELAKTTVKNLIIASDIDSFNQRPVKSISFGIFEGLGTAYGYLKIYDKAIENLSRAIAVEPNEKEGYLNRALTYYNTKNYDLALADYRQCIKFNPKNDGAYYRCALCEGHTGLYRAAISDMTVAIQLDTAEGNYYFTRAKLYKLLSVTDSARMDAMKAKELGLNIDSSWLQ
ncbi:MAG: tetratricopeptide repeat protein [Flavipsychrobacter sp.]|nr:tetratricopeptide repeat protein [Flavipsychrobacter sp.]